MPYALFSSLNFSLIIFTQIMFQVQCAKNGSFTIDGVFQQAFLGAHSVEGTLDFRDLIIKLNSENFLYSLDM